VEAEGREEKGTRVMKAEERLLRRWKWVGKSREGEG
jgi:hypothetical protein